MEDPWSDLALSMFLFAKLHARLFFFGINRVRIMRCRKGFQRDPSRPFGSFHPETVTIDPFDDPFDRLMVQESNFHSVTLLRQRHDHMIHLGRIIN